MSQMKLVFLSLSVSLLISCGGSDNSPTTAFDTITDTTVPTGTDTLDLKTKIAIANSFCTNQKKLQIVSASLLSAYSPKGNGADLNYCGGENNYVVNGADFSMALNDYCVNARGQQVSLNGNILGSTDSGSNFISTIENLNVAGTDIDLDITGNTWDGRADDNFVTIQVTDNVGSDNLILEDVSIKKGEFDFGFFTFQDLNRVPFKFISHFNDDNTQGLLFIYGEGEEKTIISGDNGMVTAVFTKDRHDAGTWLDLPCNN